MTEPRKPSLVLPVAGAVLLLAGLYVGAYYGTVRVKRVMTITTMIGVPGFETVTPEYPMPFLERFFRLAHRLDLRVRPKAWEPTPQPEPNPPVPIIIKPRE